MGSLHSAMRWMPTSTMPKCSWMILARGARQFVVHDALDTTWCAGDVALKEWWLTPITNMGVSSFGGAEMTAMGTTMRQALRVRRRCQARRFASMQGAGAAQRRTDTLGAAIQMRLGLGL